MNFPGNNSSAGFYAMLCFMAASGLGSYVALSSLAFPRRSEAAAHAHRRSTTIMLVVLAALAAIGGVLFL